MGGNVGHQRYGEMSPYAVKADLADAKRRRVFKETQLAR